MNLVKHIKKNDPVIILSGKDKGKISKVTSILHKKNKVVVEGVNVVSKHKKSDGGKNPAGIVKMESPIHACKVSYYSSELSKPIRLGRKVFEGKAFRFSHKHNLKID